MTEVKINDGDIGSYFYINQITYNLYQHILTITCQVTSYAASPLSSQAEAVV